MEKVRLRASAQWILLWISKAQNRNCTPSTMRTRLRHRQLVTYTFTSSLEIYWNLFCTFFWHSSAPGCFRHIASVFRYSHFLSVSSHELDVSLYLFTTVSLYVTAGLFMKKLQAEWGCWSREVLRKRGVLIRSLSKLRWGNTAPSLSFLVHGVVFGHVEHQSWVAGFGAKTYFLVIMSGPSLRLMRRCRCSSRQ
jgi:hypothetical protein